MNGTTIGHYQFLERLGEGVMGAVDKVRDVLLNPTAALKSVPVTALTRMRSGERREPARQ